MRNIAVVLSGGTGTRVGADLPKQYLELAGKPVIVHTLERLQRCRAVDGVIVTASDSWKERLLQWKETFALTKLLAVAPAGKDRQLSIKSGSMAAEPFMDRDGSSGVVIQDAARPLTSVGLLTRLLDGLKESPAVMPALPITDTTYTSRDGRWVDGLLDRSTLFAGQAPEAFRFWPYLALYRDTPEEILSTMSGSCQLPYSRGWQVKMIPGEPRNIKITYFDDLRSCEELLVKQLQNEELNCER